jgi:hypothetical protein
MTNSDGYLAKLLCVPLLKIVVMINVFFLTDKHRQSIISRWKCHDLINLSNFRLLQVEYIICFVIGFYEIRSCSYKLVVR